MAVVVTDDPATSLRERLAAARGPARELAAEIRRRYRPRDPALSRPGHARGVDAYSEADLERVITTIFAYYRKVAGRYPDLLQPRLYSEKINALKLFAYFKVPESGNKLATASFLTPDAAAILRMPEVAWHSPQAGLPANDAVPPGEYYLKSSHGSGQCLRIRYPLSPESRETLDAQSARWLVTRYGLETGEWWYGAFRPQLLLERCVTRRDPSAAILYFLFRGEVHSIYVDEKLLDGTHRARASLYDPEFRLLPEAAGNSEPIGAFSISDGMKERALAAVRSIGRTFEAVRVDLIAGDAEDLLSLIHI